MHPSAKYVMGHGISGHTGSLDDRTILIFALYSTAALTLYEPYSLFHWTRSFSISGLTLGFTACIKVSSLFFLMTLRTRVE